MTYLPIMLGLAAGLSTYIGGIATWRFTGRAGPVYALTGGLVLGLALLDLLPTAVHSAADTNWEASIFPLAATGFALYLLLYRMPAVSSVGRLTLTGHSLIDGLGVGIAFQISSATGWLIAAGVLAHDLADGANIVGLSLASGSKRTRGWLLANASAPVLGAFIGQYIAPETHALSGLLALFAGGFLYIGVCDLIPRSLASGSNWTSPLATVSGILFMGFIVHLLR